MQKRNLLDEVEELKKYASDNYEAGGHWVVETYLDLNYAEVVFEYPSLEAGKEGLKEYWEMMVDREQDCRFE